ncbi:hypothetical protein MUP77_22440 [Candidatus Bathyarchaeota archaeon]|nr:hypothetical protein [Candidatus Bathyarchaeota archaeon]
MLRREETCPVKANEKNPIRSEKNGATEHVLFQKGKLGKRGRIHYFYHSPFSTLPIRDVCNGQGEGWKTEPHIEIGAENYVGPCRPTNIVAHLNRDDETYLFLVTTCRNRQMQENNITYFVGYIEKSEELITKDKRHALKGRIFLFPFEKCVPYKSIFQHFAPMRLVDEKTIKTLLSRLPKPEEKDRLSFLRECVKEIRKLDKRNKKERKTCLILRGEDCDYKSECLRWNPP